MDCPGVNCNKPMVQLHPDRYMCPRCHRTVLVTGTAEISTVKLIEVQVWREDAPDFGFACTEADLEAELAQARLLPDIERIVIEYPNGEKEER
jgi:hypothetical protein